MIGRRNLLTLGLAALSGPMLTRPAFAEVTFPDRPIRLVISFAPGGGYDAVGRQWAEKMKPLLGTVIVENQGGGGRFAWALLRSPVPSPTATPSLSADRLPTLPKRSSRAVRCTIQFRELEPIANVVVAAYALAIHPAVPARTLQEFIDHAEANPGKLFYGHAGVGTLNHLTGELLKSLTGTDIVPVPYRGSGPATVDALAGQVALVIPAVTGPLLELHRAGKLRISAVTSPKRLIAAPEIPTAVEAGFPGMISQQSIGLFAPDRHIQGDHRANCAGNAYGNRRTERISSCSSIWGLNQIPI